MEAEKIISAIIGYFVYYPTIIFMICSGSHIPSPRPGPLILTPTCTSSYKVIVPTHTHVNSTWKKTPHAPCRMTILPLCFVIIWLITTDVAMIYLVGNGIRIESGRNQSSIIIIIIVDGSHLFSQLHRLDFSPWLSQVMIIWEFILNPTNHPHRHTAETFSNFILFFFFF